MRLSDSEVIAAFVEGGRGRSFVVQRRPRRLDSGSAVLFVPPFAEEMNKCRRMFTLVAEGLARVGRAAVIVDLFGTGDSEGEFKDAEWEGWIDDLVRAAAWSAHSGWVVTGMVCARGGCLLGGPFARLHASPISTTVFWQPVLDGQRLLTQFLRLRVAAMMAGAGPKESVSSLRERLAAGESVEVSGYELGPLLVQQIDQAELSPAQGSALGALHWMEVARSSGAAPSTTATKWADEYRTSGDQLAVSLHDGEPFWSSTETVVNTSVVDATVAAFA